MRVRAAGRRVPATMNARTTLTLLPAAALVAAGGTTALATAAGEPAPPVAQFTLAANGAPSGPATVAPGAVRITVGTKAKGRHAFQVLKLAPGADVAAVQKQVARVKDDDAFEAITAMSAVGGTGVSSAQKGSIVADLQPGTYLLADISSQKTVPSTPFTVTDGSGPALPAAPAATISMYDYKFEVAGRLPRRGDVRLTNRGRRNHILVVFKAADAKGAARLVKAVKADDQRAAGKEIRGEGSGANVIGPGVTHDLRVADAPGNYVLACFVRSKQSGGKAHNRLGMVKAVVVR